jgi:hypothetical protein
VQDKTPSVPPLSVTTKIAATKTRYVFLIDTVLPYCVQQPLYTFARRLGTVPQDIIGIFENTIRQVRRAEPKPRPNVDAALVDIRRTISNPS